ncbi:MAG: nucleotidyltransferase domain-containing protein [Planctomycetota bacterium]|jgi:predicted nucleotidyltransferase
MEQIQELGRQIGREFHPERVVLFGSYAYGTAREDSDVDLLVVISHKGKGWRLAGKIRGRVCPQFPVDLLVRSPEQIRQRLKLGDCFLKEITEQGKVLYESTGG